MSRLARLAATLRDLPQQFRRASLMRQALTCLAILLILSALMSLSLTMAYSNNPGQRSVEGELIELPEGSWSMIDLYTALVEGQVSVIGHRDERLPAIAGQPAMSLTRLIARTQSDTIHPIEVDREPSAITTQVTLWGFGHLIASETRQSYPFIALPPRPGPSIFELVLLAGVIFLIIFFVVRFVRRSSGQQAPVNSKTENFAPRGDLLSSSREVRLEDVAGCEEAKLELTETIDFLKHHQRFNSLGARMPSGVLLYGPPGTGKTMLARAVASEAGVPFFFASGSEFIEMYVGVGASRIRQIFAAAKKAGRGVIFIDEIDAMAKRRQHNGLSSNEHDQTLNQLLVELDGFSRHDNIVVIGATNRIDVLDEALLRPGRFTRKVHVGYPDVEGRRSILATHARNKRLADSVDLTALARKTARMTGAQLADILNESAILAARREATEITNSDLQAGLLKVQIGTSRARSMDERERAIIAVHETGHAFCGLLSGSKLKVEEISIYAHGEALGVTVYSQEDNDLPAEADLRAMLISMMGGKAAEDIFFSQATPGASSDFAKATEIARQMVYHWGMGRDPEATSQGPSGRGILGFLAGADGLSPVRQAAAERAMQAILEEAYVEARAMILGNLGRFWLLASQLHSAERLSGEDMADLFNQPPTELGHDWRPAVAHPRPWPGAVSGVLLDQG